MANAGGELLKQARSWRFAVAFAVFLLCFQWPFEGGAVGQADGRAEEPALDPLGADPAPGRGTEEQPAEPHECEAGLRGGAEFQALAS